MMITGCLQHKLQSQGAWQVLAHSNIFHLHYSNYRSCLSIPCTTLRV